MATKDEASAVPAASKTSWTSFLKVIILPQQDPRSIRLL